MRTLIAIVLLLAGFAARAGNPYGYVFTIGPNPVPPGSAIGVTIETVGVPCVPLADTLPVTIAEEGVVYLSVPGSDACDAVVPEKRSYSIGPFPPGQYTFRFYTCSGLSDGGEDACLTLEEFPVTVGGFSAERTTIPSLGMTGIVGLVVLVLGVGLLRKGLDAC